MGDGDFAYNFLVGGSPVVSGIAFGLAPVFLAIGVIVLWDFIRRIWDLNGSPKETMSNTLLFLRTADFRLERHSASGNKFLCTGIKDFSFILFYGDKCPHCQRLIPIVKQLPGKISGVFIGMAKVDHALVALAKQTVTPIEHVPLMVFYYGGRPHTIYASEYTERGIINFLMDMTTRIRTQEQQVKDVHKQRGGQTAFTPQPQNGGLAKFCRRCQKQQRPNQKKCTCVIPEFCYGIPFSEEVTYLEFEEAYTGVVGAGTQ